MEHFLAVQDLSMLKRISGPRAITIYNIGDGESFVSFADR